MASPYAPGPDAFLVGTNVTAPPPPPTPVKPTRKCCSRTALRCAVPLLLGAIAVSLGVAAEYLYQKEVKKARCTVSDEYCSIVPCMEYRPPMWLIVAASVLTLFIAVVSTSLGFFPCCLPAKDLKRTCSVHVSFAAFLLLWLVAAAQVAYAMQVLVRVSTRKYPKRDPTLCCCIDSTDRYVLPTGLVTATGVAGLLVALLGAAHILTGRRAEEDTNEKHSSPSHTVPVFV